ncbi:MAG: ATP-binding cassette domain-containing protein [Nitrospiraceae bacterium]|nr:ATP-binding cassette domain-containing protein [Nitrospiraceae bacterium]
MTVHEAKDAVLELQDVCVGVGDTQLLSGVSLCLRRAELVALNGPSGCGKSTLLRAIAGLIDMERGTVSLEGRPAGEEGWPAFRRRVILVDQRPIMRNTSVWENLKRPFSYAVSSRSFPAGEAEGLLKRLRLDGPAKHRDARLLSGGEQQRVNLIRALLLEPDVLLLDEPTNSLDHEAALVVEALLREEAERRGAAALVVTHDRRGCERWCDRVFDVTPHLPHVHEGAGHE